MVEMDILDIGDDRLDPDDDVDDTLDRGGGFIPAPLNALDVGDAAESLGPVEPVVRLLPI